MSQADNFFNLDALDQGLSRQLSKGMSTRIFAGKDAMISIVRIEPNMTGSIHSHPQEQWGLCIRGSGKRFQGSETFDINTGDFWRTPGGVEHGFTAGRDGALIYDVFAPPREEYTKKGSGFG
ncbi:MAG: cupin domain-containing protein [Gammaproteobacteria bacterium]|nr:cupin domain-containing protein [Gammaproteobacteria bacterium]